MNRIYLTLGFMLTMSFLTFAASFTTGPNPIVQVEADQQ